MTREEGTEDRILGAALDLFYQRGYQGTTTRAIADGAGVNEVTLFRRFGSKRNIFIEAVKRETDVSAELEESHFSLSDDLEADLTTVGLRIVGEMTARARLVKIIMMEAARDPVIWQHISSTPFGVIEKITEMFTEAQGSGRIRPDLDPYVVAVTFFSFFFRTLVANAFLGKDVFLEMDRGNISKFANIFAKGITKGA